MAQCSRNAKWVSRTLVLFSYAYELLATIAAAHQMVNGPGNSAPSWRVTGRHLSLAHNCVKGEINDLRVRHDLVAFLEKFASRIDVWSSAQASLRGPLKSPPTGNTQGGFARWS